MNMTINATSFRQNVTLFSDWVDSTPVQEVIDTITYDLYESNNPLRYKYNNMEIRNKYVRGTVNLTTSVGAEFFSVFTNPYYISHKIVNIPTAYQSVVDAYKKNKQS